MNPDDLQVESRKMEERALETLRAILGRRGLPTNTTAGDGFYTIGDKRIVFLTKNPTKPTIDKLIEEHTTNVILVTAQPPSESIRAHLATAAESRPSYIDSGVQMFHLRQLQFDIATHQVYWSPCRLLTKDEQTALMESLRIPTLKRLPKVFFDDSVALWLGAKPGDVIQYDISSETAGWSKKYRLVVTNVEEV